MVPEDRTYECMRMSDATAVAPTFCLIAEIARREQSSSSPSASIVVPSLLDLFLSSSYSVFAILRALAPLHPYGAQRFDNFIA